MPALCRDCFLEVPDDERGARATCPACGSRRVVRHPELFSLTVAHIDCDAFYASVEKRDRPELLARSVIVGGGRRGVVAACCYIARTRGVRSAMPMFKALALCPDAVVIKPEMTKYVAAGRQIRALMEDLTPWSSRYRSTRRCSTCVGRRRCTAPRPPQYWPASPAQWNSRSASPSPSASPPTG